MNDAKHRALDAACVKRARRAFKRAFQQNASAEGRARARERIEWWERSRQKKEYLCLPNWHGIDGFCIRLWDGRAGQQTGLRPVRDTPGTFDLLFLERIVTRSLVPYRQYPTWPFGGRGYRLVATWREAPPRKLAITDWREESRYSVIEIPPG